MAIGWFFTPLRRSRLRAQGLQDVASAREEVEKRRSFMAKVRDQAEETGVG